MTDQEKVNRMFEIRKVERPDLAESAERVKECLSPEFKPYHALLDLYNERYPKTERKAEQGRLF